MHTFNDVHQQFASFFKSELLQPYAYLVSKKLSEGHICLRLNEIKKEELPLPYKTLMKAGHDLKKESLITTSGEEKRPFVLFNNSLYLQRYFHYETTVLQRIIDLIAAEKEHDNKRTLALQIERNYIRALFPSTVKDKDEPDVNWQLAATVLAVLNNFTIITGGPGTGKTTTVAKILAVLYKMNPELKVALAAPTGKAAARMVESLKSASFGTDSIFTKKIQSLEPSTIHRLLGFIPDSAYFKRTRANPLSFDLVIIDESSMIDVALFAKLLDAIGPQTRIILLGDKDQLASVEAGSLFGDLCQAMPQLNQFTRERADLINSFIPESARQIDDQWITSPDTHPLFQHIIELRKSHRFASNEGIGRFSKAIIQNEVPTVRDFIEKPDQQVMVDTGYDIELFEGFAQGYEAFIKEPDIHTALKKLNQLRVLCAVREGEYGVYSINKKIEEYLKKKNLLRLSGEHYENRPIIVTGNDYNLGLFNGDTGIIRCDENGKLKAWFEDADGKIKWVLPAYISKLETVFAMTIHKSQGSEFDEVLVVLPSEENIPLLTRELLYTAVTRAKSKVYLQGKQAVILQTSLNEVKRGSGIVERFTQK